MKYESLDLIVSTYNNPYALMEIISSLESGSLQPQNLHIADDGSTEDNVQLIKVVFQPTEGKISTIGMKIKDSGSPKS